MACSKLTVGVHEMRAAASGAKTRVVAGFGWFGSDGVELDPRHISRWLQRFFPRVPSKAVRIKPIAVRVDLPETAQHPSSPCSGGSDAVPGTGENRHHHQQHRQQQEATPAAHSRVAQVQGVLAQHEAGLERYTGAEVSDALLLVDGCCGPALNHLGHSRVGKTLGTTFSRSVLINASGSWLRECNR